MIKLIDLFEVKISSSFEPEPNNTGTSSIGKKNFLVYNTPSGKFYAEMNDKDWKDYNNRQKQQSVRDRLVSKAVDERTFRKKNPTGDGSIFMN